MNEDELRREFERLICSGAFASRWDEWLHVATWADARARRECAEIALDHPAAEHHAVCYRIATTILATIKEPQE